MPDMDAYEHIIESIAKVDCEWELVGSRILSRTIRSRSGSPACPLLAASGKPGELDNFSDSALANIFGVSLDAVVLVMDASDGLPNRPATPTALRRRLLEACKLAPLEPPGETT